METVAQVGLLATDIKTDGGFSSRIDVSMFKHITIDATVRGVTGGTTPTFTLTLYRIAADGTTRRAIGAFGAAIPAAGGTQSLSVGPGMAIAQLPGKLIQIGWAVTGGPATTAFMDVDWYGRT